MTRAWPLALALVGCAGGPAWDGRPESCPGTIHAGACIAVTYGEPPTAEQTDTAVAVALEVWGLDAIRGWLVELAADSGPGCASGIACAFMEPERKIAIWNKDPCWVGYLIHEAGHAAIGGYHGDPDHTDPRWRESDRPMLTFLDACEVAPRE